MKVRQTFERLGRLPERVCRAVAIRELEAPPAAPTRDGRIFCPSCGPDAPDAYFKATADALVTAYLSPAGTIQTWKDTYVAEESYRELQCGSCDRLLGDLTFEDLQALAPDPEIEEE